MIFGSLFRHKHAPRILVAFASQTGAAERIAWLSANALAAGKNLVRVVPLGGLSAAETAAEALMPDPPRGWSLTERRLLNAGSPGGEAWHIVLRPTDKAQLNWTAGDIAEIWPRNSEALVEAFLTRHHLDGAKSFRW